MSFAANTASLSYFSICTRLFTSDLIAITIVALNKHRMTRTTCFASYFGQLAISYKQTSPLNTRQLQYKRNKQDQYSALFKHNN